MAVRIMELAGLIANKNTIPGDELTALGSGVRLGTPWVTQRGMGPEEMDAIAAAIHRLLTAIHPFHYDGLIGELPRGKLDLDVLEAIKQDVAGLAAGAAAETGSLSSGYPHYFFLDEAQPPDGRGLLLVSGWRAKPFFQEVGTADVASLQPQFLMRIEHPGRGHDQVRFDVAQFAQPLEQPHAVDGAGRAGDRDDQPPRLARGQATCALSSTCFSSPDSNISIMMSEPPTNSPFT